MVEVVGTAPTSAMVITKFVYRRSWQANTINIKTILRDSTKIMKLTKEQSQEIKDQQSQQNPTKRVTAPELEKILYEAMPALDHGFVRVIDYMGDDTSIVQSARVSYGKGTKQVSTDSGLIKYLMRHWHSTPFEMCEIKYHVKIPFIQNVVYLDKRILNLDTPPEEVIASDQKRLIVDAFARFKIVDPLKFYISVGNERVARSRLSTIINSRIRNVLGQQELQTLLSKDRTKQMSLIQEGVNAEAENFGIEIVDVRIKRADLPQANSDAIFRRMQTEREREAKEFRAKGAEMAVTITSTADKEVTVILANAQKESEIMKGEGDGQRNKIFANAFGRDPEFFAFYRAMQAYETALIGGDTSLILSPDSEFFSNNFWKSSKSFSLRFF